MYLFNVLKQFQLDTGIAVSEGVKAVSKYINSK